MNLEQRYPEYVAIIYPAGEPKSRNMWHSTTPFLPFHVDPCCPDSLARRECIETSSGTKPQFKLSGRIVTSKSKYTTMLELSCILEHSERIFFSSLERSSTSLLRWSEILFGSFFCLLILFLSWSLKDFPNGNPVSCAVEPPIAHNPDLEAYKQYSRNCTSRARSYGMFHSPQPLWTFFACCALERELYELVSWRADWINEKN